jgi:hypothetical protein
MSLAVFLNCHGSLLVALKGKELLLMGTIIENSLITCLWAEQPKYVMKKFVPETSPYSMYMACTAYIREETRWSRDFPSSLYVASTAYIRDEKLVQRLPL